MEKFQKEFIGLIQAAFTDKKIDISSDFNWKKAVDLAKNHNIASILYYGAVNCNISKENDYMQELDYLTLQSIMTNTRQIYEIEQIEKAFEKESIDYMPLKGSVLKSLYPKPEMRTMGDADILIKLDQYPKIEKIMTELGFAYQFESDHELVWEKKPSLFLELHKSVMTSYNKDFYGYFGDGWKIANNVAGSYRYEMSLEDFYIYIFVHFTKHYRISGIGIKHLLDLWVYSNARPDLNLLYIENELKKMNLGKFHENVKRVINVWFNGAAETEITDLITNVIFNSGQYGSEDMAIINRALQNGNESALKIKLARLFGGIFLPYSSMKEKYAVLKKLPILLPIMWVVRCFDILLRQKLRLKKYMKKLNEIDSKKFKENEQALNAVGLDFNFEE